MHLIWSTPKGPVHVVIPEGLTSIEFDEAREAINIQLRSAERRIPETQNNAGEIEYASWFLIAPKEHPHD